MGSKAYQKGARLEYEFMYYLRYHGFDVFRSYASKGHSDLRAVPHKFHVVNTTLYAQCKNTKKADYITPKERMTLYETSQVVSGIMIEPYKIGGECWVRLEPWKLHGDSMSPDAFLSYYYKFDDAHTWKQWKKNWTAKPRIWRHPKANIELDHDVNAIG